MSSIAQEYSLFEIDQELDLLVDEIEEEIETRSEAPAKLNGAIRRLLPYARREG